MLILQVYKVPAAVAELLMLASLVVLGVRCENAPPSTQSPDSYPASFYHTNWNERLVSGNPATDYANDAGKFLINSGGNGEGANPASFMTTIFVEFQPCAAGHPHMHTSPPSDELMYVLDGNFTVGFVRGNYSAVEYKDLQANEQTLFPAGFLHWLYNPTCETAHMIQVYNQLTINVVYPYRAIVNLPATPFAAETGVSPEASPEEAVEVARSTHPSVDRIMYGSTECYERCGLPVPESYKVTATVGSG